MTILERRRSNYGNYSVMGINSANRYPTYTKQQYLSFSKEPFAFRPRYGKLNVRLLHQVDPEQIMGDSDIEAIRAHMENLTFSKIAESDVSTFNDEFVVKIFNMMQLTMEYLTTTAQNDRCLNEQLSDVQAEMEQEILSVDAQLTLQKSKNAQLLKENKLKTKQLDTYESLLRPRISEGQERSFACEQCGKNFQSEFYLQSHRTRRHTETQETIESISRVVPVQKASPRPDQASFPIQKASPRPDQESSFQVEKVSPRIQLQEQKASPRPVQEAPVIPVKSALDVPVQEEVALPISPGARETITTADLSALQAEVKEQHDLAERVIREQTSKMNDQVEFLRKELESHMLSMRQEMTSLMSDLKIPLEDKVDSLVKANESLKVDSLERAKENLSDRLTLQDEVNDLKTLVAQRRTKAGDMESDTESESLPQRPKTHAAISDAVELALRSSQQSLLSQISQLQQQSKQHNRRLESLLKDKLNLDQPLSSREPSERLKEAPEKLNLDQPLSSREPSERLKEAPEKLNLDQPLSSRQPSELKEAPSISSTTPVRSTPANTPLVSGRVETSVCSVPPILLSNVDSQPETLRSPESPRGLDRLETFDDRASEIETNAQSPKKSYSYSNVEVFDAPEDLESPRVDLESPHVGTAPVAPFIEQSEDEQVASPPSPEDSTPSDTSLLSITESKVDEADAVFRSHARESVEYTRGWNALLEDADRAKFMIQMTHEGHLGHTQLASVMEGETIRPLTEEERKPWLVEKLDVAENVESPQGETVADNPDTFAVEQGIPDREHEETMDRAIWSSIWNGQQALPKIDDDAFPFKLTYLDGTQATFFQRGTPPRLVKTENGVEHYVESFIYNELNGMLLDFPSCPLGRQLPPQDVNKIITSLQRLASALGVPGLDSFVAGVNVERYETEVNEVSAEISRGTSSRATTPIGASPSATPPIASPSATPPIATPPKSPSPLLTPPSRTGLTSSSRTPTVLSPARTPLASPNRTPTQSTPSGSHRESAQSHVSPREAADSARGPEKVDNSWDDSVGFTSFQMSERSPRLERQERDFEVQEESDPTEIDRPQVFNRPKDSPERSSWDDILDDLEDL